MNNPLMSQPMEKHSFSEQETTFRNALARADADAIRRLSVALQIPTYQFAKQYHLPKEEAEEAIDDAILLTIKKIRNGDYEAADAGITAYAVGIARNLLRNRARRHKAHLSDTELLGAEDENLTQWMENKEKQQQIGYLLSHLGDTCQKLIRLFYLDGYSDAEVVELQLSPYSTTDTVKNKRCACMKKLSELAKQKFHNDELR